MSKRSAWTRNEPEPVPDGAASLASSPVLPHSSSTLQLKRSPKRRALNNGSNSLCTFAQAFSLNPYLVKGLLSIRNTVNKVEPFEIRVTRIRIIINIIQADFKLEMRNKVKTQIVFLSYKLLTSTQHNKGGGAPPPTQAPPPPDQNKVCAEDVDANARHAHASILLK